MNFRKAVVKGMTKYIEYYIEMDDYDGYWKVMI